jgi:tight adherence protein B
MSNQMWIFIGTIFFAVALLSQAMIIPVFGEGRQTRKKLKARLGELEREIGQGSFSSLLRDKYLRELSPLERSLEQLPFMAPLTDMIEQAGHSFLAHRLVLAAIGLAVTAAAGAWTFTRNPLIALLAAAMAAALPFLKVARDRTQRIQKVEEQLP